MNLLDIPPPRSPFYGFEHNFGLVVTLCLLSIAGLALLVYFKRLRSIVLVLWMIVCIILMIVSFFLSHQ
jgi:hypothetical protein